jgi:probable HAF family extracellular repeat protein
MHRGSTRRSAAKACALVFAVAFWPAVSASELPQYQILEIGPPSFPAAGAYRYTVPVKINEDGWVVGYAFPGIISTGTFLFRSGTTELISTVDWPIDINNSGQVLLQFAEMGADAYVWMPDGTTRQLEPIENYPIWANDINDFGVVTGERYAGVESGSSPRPPADDSFAFVASDSGVVDLPRLTNLGPAGGRCEGVQINNTGGVIGNCIGFDQESIPRAFLSAGGSIIELGVPGEPSSAGLISEMGHVVFSSGADTFLYVNGVAVSVGMSVTAMNDSGELVGSLNGRASRYKDGALLDLGTLGGAESLAMDINEAGEIIGKAQLDTGFYRAFVYRAGQMYNLGALGREDSEAISINDVGQLTGVAYNSSAGPFPLQEYIGFLATPISLLLDRLRLALVGVGPGKALASSVATATAQYSANDLGGTCGALDEFVGKASRFTGDRKRQVPGTSRPS